MAMIRFTYLNREWRGELVLNEANTRELPRVTPVVRGPPWPRREEYRGAVLKFREITIEAATNGPAREAILETEVLQKKLVKAARGSIQDIRSRNLKRIRFCSSAPQGSA